MGILEDHKAFHFGLPRQKYACSLWDFLSMWSGLLPYWCVTTIYVPDSHHSLCRHRLWLCAYRTYPST